MSLTREMEQRLDRAGLIAHFNANQPAWQGNCQDPYDYTKKALGAGVIRPDDVAKPLRAAVEIDIPLRKVLDAKRLSQKYWIDYFTALVIERTWAALNK